MIVQLTAHFGSTERRQVVRLLSGLERLYPNFEPWLAAKITAPDTLLIGAIRNGECIGVGIGKTGAIPKLRCVRVHPDYQGSGIGLKLVDQLIERLQSEKPHCTVAEEMFHEYGRPFVNRYGFALTNVTKGEYRPGKLEYHWN